MRKSINRFWLTVTVCAVAVINMGQLVTSSGLAYIAAAFPDVKELWISLLVTGSAVTQVPAGILSGYLARRIPKKRLLVFALLLFLITGLAPFFLRSFPLILLMRILFGAAAGISVPVGASLCFDFYESEREQSRMLGLNSAFSMLGGVYFTFAGGQLSELGWQYCFLAYLIGIPILLLVLLFLPEQEVASPLSGAQSERRSTAYRMSPIAMVMAVFLLFYLSLYFIYTTNISAFVLETGMGGSAESGLSYSVVNGAGILGGVCFGFLFQRIKHWVTPFAFLITGAGFLIIAMSTSLPVLFGGSVLIGLGIAWIMPHLNYVYGVVSKPEDRTLTMGIATAVGQCGQLVSSFMISWLCRAFHITTSKGQLMVGTYGYFAVTVLTVAFTVYMIGYLRRQEEAAQEES